MQTVYEELKRQILTFQLVPGSALEERQILRTLGFSRTPFREACMRLKEEGWLLAFSRRGFLIAPITFEDILHIYELRLILESACAQIAAVRATPSDVERMEKMIRAEDTCSSTEAISADLVKMNFEFHLLLAELTQNTRLTHIVRNILEHVTRFDSMLTRYAPSTSWVTHSSIVEAVRSHDSVRAGKNMQDHIEQARMRIVSAFTRDSPKLSLPVLAEKPARKLSATRTLETPGNERGTNRDPATRHG
jgi:DNA-binding GntR family transcriptional regulator